MTKREEIKAILEILYQHGELTPVNALFALDSRGVVLKVDKKINGNLVNNLWDAMQPVDLDECRLLVKQALEGAGYYTVESLIKEEENETSL